MDKEINAKDIYNPSELNKILLNETKNIAINFSKIYITGDIKDFRKWKFLVGQVVSEDFHVFFRPCRGPFAKRSCFLYGRDIACRDGSLRLKQY